MEQSGCLQTTEFQKWSSFLLEHSLFSCYSKHPGQRMASAVKEHFLFSCAQLGSMREVVWLLRCYCLQRKQYVLSAFEYLADCTEVPSDIHNRCQKFRIVLVLSFLFFIQLFQIRKTLSSKISPQFHQTNKTSFSILTLLVAANYKLCMIPWNISCNAL